MSVDALIGFIRRRACPLYLSDVHLRTVIEHVLPEYRDGAAGTLSFATFTQCMLRVLDAVGLSPLGMWGAEVTAEERSGEQIATDIGGFALSRRIAAFPCSLRFAKATEVTFLHVPCIVLHTPHRRFSRVLLIGS